MKRNAIIALVIATILSCSKEPPTVWEGVDNVSIRCGTLRDNVATCVASDRLTYTCVKTDGESGCKSTADIMSCAPVTQPLPTEHP